MFAVVAISGKQYKIAKGDTLVVDRIDGNVGDSVRIDHVLLVNDGGKSTVGTPYVKGTSVIAKVLVQGKGKKIDVMRFKSKVRERRHIGFRARETTLEIVTVGKA